MDTIYVREVLVVGRVIPGGRAGRQADRKEGRQEGRTEGTKEGLRERRTGGRKK